MNDLNPKTFYFETPLYTPIKITDANFEHLSNLIDFSGKINYFNPVLKENTTYQVKPKCISGKTGVTDFGGWDYSRLVCLRTNEEFLCFYQYDADFPTLNNGVFKKIGQIPSLADFNTNSIKKYDKILDNEKRKEFSKAIGLVANGIGIGSFVYLRRIFESLIEEAHLKAKEGALWNEHEYKKQRMSERIELLKDHLPAFLVDNKSLYGIISTGIHLLKEDECLAYFQTVRVGIELILDEKLQQMEKDKKILEAKNKISELAKHIKYKSGESQ